jgi:hypothetical protein
MPDRSPAAPGAPGWDRPDAEALWQTARALRADAERPIDDAAARSARPARHSARSRAGRERLHPRRPFPVRSRSGLHAPPTVW